MAVVSALVAAWQARTATISVKQERLRTLFSGFDAASQATLQNPNLLYEVHGLDRSVPKEEAVAIAYFSMLLDAFQQFYDREYNGDYQKMAEEAKRRSTFLNRILAVPQNAQRWQTVKKNVLR